MAEVKVSDDFALIEHPSKVDPSDMQVVPYRNGRGVPKNHRKKMAAAIGLKAMRSFFPPPELKRAFSVAFWDAASVGTPAGTPLSQAFLGGIVQGTTSQTRVGDRIFVERITIRGTVTENVAQTYGNVAIAMIEDKEPIAGSYSWAFPYQGIGAASANAYMVAIPNYDRRVRFNYHQAMKIPLSWTAAVSNGGVTTASQKTHFFEMSIPVRRTIKYDANSGVAAGSEFTLWAWSDANSNLPFITASYEVFFTDV